MPSTETRRTLLRMVASSAAVGLAGCLGSDPADESTARPTTTTTTGTGSETDDADSHGTNTCEEQPITADVRVRNDRDDPVTVEVTVSDRTADATLFEATYDVSAGDRVEEDDRIFSTLATQTAHEVWAEATVGEETVEEDVSLAAQDPLNYGVAVAVTADGVSVYDYHADPGPAVNWDCYPRE